MSDSITPPDSRTPFEIVFNLALGYLLSRCIQLVAELRIADLLAAGPVRVEELAEKAGADPESLYRVLRALAAQGVFSEVEKRCFELTPAASLLGENVMRDGILLCGDVAGDGSWWEAAGRLKSSVQTGIPAFQLQTGVGFFEYVQRNQDCGIWFDRGMADFSKGENQGIVSAFDFQPFKRIIDVGGGKGGFVAEILQCYPNISATVFDLPGVIANAPPSRSIHLKEGDFFNFVPEGGDLYVLKRILHDWNDAECAKILANCRKAMTESSRLLIVEALLPEGNAPHPAKTMDILMLIFGPGRERTETEFQRLLKSTGFELKWIGTTPTSLSILEACPV